MPTEQIWGQQTDGFNEASFEKEGEEKKKAVPASPCQYWLSLLACVHCQGQHAVFTHKNTLHTHISLEPMLMLNGERFLSLFHYQSSESRRKSRGDTEGEEEQQETKMDKTRY